MNTLWTSDEQYYESKTTNYIKFIYIKNKTYNGIGSKLLYSNVNLVILNINIERD